MIHEMTLEEDFDIWWNKMRKYRTHDIPAKEFSKIKLIARHGSNRGWPGPQKDVKYWVELANGYAVGFRHDRGEIRWKKYAEFPIEKMK